MTSIKHSAHILKIVYYAIIKNSRGFNFKQKHSTKQKTLSEDTTVKNPFSEFFIVSFPFSKWNGIYESEWGNISTPNIP